MSHLIPQRLPRKSLLFVAGIFCACLANASAGPDLNDAASSGNLSVVSDMIAHGVPVNAGKGSYKFTPLMGAEYGGHVDVLDYLLAHGAQIDQGDSEGSTVLLHSCNDDRTEIALALLKAGANPNIGSRFHRYPLMYAAEKGNDTIVAALIAAHADLEATCNEGTAISWALTSGKVSTVQLLLQAGAKTDAQDAKGYTVLSRAIFGNDDAMFHALLEAHAGLEVRDKRGQTPLIQAAACNANDLAEELVQAGADINAVDNQGETALTRAGDSGDSDLVNFLAGKGAKRTDLHIIPKLNPVAPLPPARAWALVLGAMYTQQSEGDHRVLGGGDRQGRARKMLTNWWGINDKAGLLHELDDLSQHGHHELYQAEGARLAAMSPGEFQSYLGLHPDHQYQITSEKESYLKWKDRSALAWDLCRSSMLINEGYAAHYINAKEAWDRLMPLARRSQQSFSSWHEMADNFLDGRKIWATDPKSDIPPCVELLLNPNDPNSPWNYLPWSTDLSGS